MPHAIPTPQYPRSRTEFSGRTKTVHMFVSFGEIPSSMPRTACVGQGKGKGKGGHIIVRFP